VYFLEYNLSPGDVGYCPEDKAMNIRGKNRELRTFLPREEYGGRRIEEFHTQAEAEYLMGRFSGAIALFRWATDVLSSREVESIAALIDAKVAPLNDEINDLKAEVAKLQKPKTTRAKKDK